MHAVISPHSPCGRPSSPSARALITRPRPHCTAAVSGCSRGEPTMTFPRPLFPIAITRPFTVCGIAALILLAGSASLAAQVLYGSMVGNVTDSSGGAVPGATITITHTETGASHEAVTDANGTYRFSTVQPGTYTMTVKLTGFRTFTRENVPVTLNSITRVDAAMQVGQLSENVTVSADTPMLQTDRAEVRSELKARELVNLPVSMNRNYQYMFRVLPGFTPPAEAHSVPSNPSRAL